MSAVIRMVFATVLVICPLFAFGQTSPAPAKTQAEVSFHFERVGLPVPKFTLSLNEDGTGRYEADQAEIPATANSMRGQAAQHIDRPITLTSGTVAKIFKDARALNYFNLDCASKAKNIANSGDKTLSYKGTDGSGSCTYNYSENKIVESLTDTFLAIAYTMDEGRRFEFLHKYDRLGLDAEMITFSQEIEAGRALELETIAPTLASLADDGALIQRVRLKAQKLLEQVSAANH
ncbi:MAG: hypothetical protein WDN23_10720 [Edaphobacter sp.]